MSPAVALLVAVPVLFNLAFAELGRTFSYPDVLRRPAAEVLRMVRDGGAGLTLRWWAFLLSALLMVPLVVLITDELELTGGLAQLVTAVGVLAALVQVLGLVRWVQVVPWLAARHEHADAAEQLVLESQLALLNRLFGVAIGEHLGYLLTGAWTALLGAALLTTALSVWIAIAGLVLGALLALCSLEFVARPGEHGWRAAEAATPVVYIAWSLWLVALGVLIALA
jgi:Domain of unknown function (DUF4386)